MHIVQPRRGLLNPQLALASRCLNTHTFPQRTTPVAVCSIGLSPLCRPAKEAECFNRSEPFSLTEEPGTEREEVVGFPA